MAQSADPSTTPATAADRPTQTRRWVMVALAMLTVVTFVPTLWCDFVNLDDNELIYNNEITRAGLTPAGIWHVISTMEFGYPIPVTQLSLMADATVFGVERPWGFHLTNLLLHTANVVLLFVMLHRLTGSTWRSAAVAALWSVHPLRVESVAWVTERKDLLAGFFGLLTVLAYSNYVRQPSTRRHFTMLGLFALSLLSKPMLAVLPALLLLLDIWPLRRAPMNGSPTDDAASTTFAVRTWRQLIVEKLPLAALTAGLILLGKIGSDAFVAARYIPLMDRVNNALVSYVRYLYHHVWFDELCGYYPMRWDGWPLWAVAGSAVFLATVMVLVLLQARTRPWLAAGWLWFVLVMIPSSGIMPLGEYAMADRYTYPASIGLLVMIVWSIPLQIERLRRLGYVVGAVILCVCAIGSMRQIRHWRDGEALFARAVEVTDNNIFALNNIANHQAREGRFEEAIANLRKALRADPTANTVRHNLSRTLMSCGRPAEALAELDVLLSAYPTNSILNVDRGAALQALGRKTEAESAFGRAVESDASAAAPRIRLAQMLVERGDLSTAATHLQKAAEAEPDNFLTHLRLATLLNKLARPEEASRHASRAMELRTGSSDALRELAHAELAAGRDKVAAEAYEALLAMNPNDPSARDGFRRARLRLSSVPTD